MGYRDCFLLATLDSVRLLNLDNRIGSLDEDKTADLVIVDGNPIADMAVLRAENGKAVIDRNAGSLLVRTGDFVGTTSSSYVSVRRSYAERKNAGP